VQLADLSCDKARVLRLAGVLATDRLFAMANRQEEAAVVITKGQKF
jgi:hypothetical protein